MIIFAKLPPLEHYKLTGEASGLKIYSDRTSDRFQIAVPESNLWGKVWKIHIQESKNKSDKSVYLTRFKCLEVSTAQSHRIDRDLYKGYIGSAYQTDFHYCIQIESLLWLSYSISPSAK